MSDDLTGTASLRPCARPSCPDPGWVENGLCNVCGMAPSSDDPHVDILVNPVFPEHSRACSKCHQPVGRSQRGGPGPQQGVCETCWAPFDFTVKLVRGELVAGQYQVIGPFAHGGQGWLYLARDRSVSNRWCVLKGLLDTEDIVAAEAAEAEKGFLAELEHPAIVDIYNFVRHNGQDYIVMKHIRGFNLAKTRKEKGPLEVTPVADHLLTVLPALSYLHRNERVYCDFKPDNLMQAGNAVTLIDLGGVRRLGGADGSKDPRPIISTPGYQAPEVARRHTPTEASDLYSVGRTLAVLILDWPAWNVAERDGGDRFRLPPRDDHKVLRDHDSLYRFLVRACHPDPRRRFADADDMTETLRGVSCQVAAAIEDKPHPYESARWSTPEHTLRHIDWRTLPRPVLPDHPRLANQLTGAAHNDPVSAIRLARSGQPLSWADTAAVVWAHCVCSLADDAEGDPLGDADRAAALLSSRAAASRRQRALVDTARSYLYGVVALARHADALRRRKAAAGHAAAAVEYFGTAYAEAPGELACALAYAMALEATGDPNRLEQAATVYRQVARTDPTWVAAVAGLARVHQALGRPDDAARTYTMVPATDPSQAEALTLACHVMENSRYDQGVADKARQHLDHLAPGEHTVSERELAAAWYGATLAALRRRETVAGNPSRRDLARAHETALLELAEVTPSGNAKHELYDAAACTRPWSLW